MPIEVLDVESMHRYELLEDGELLGYLAYADRHLDPPGDGRSGTDTGDRDQGDDAAVEQVLVRDLQHTVIDPAQRGRGLGSVLVPAVLDDIRARGAKLMPTCPFVRGWIDEHPEQQDLVA